MIMNKRMIVLIALVVAVSAVPASAETLEVRGTIEELDVVNPALTYDRVWDYSNFAGFWCDLDGGLATETLTILATVPSGETNEGSPTLNYVGDDRTIDENTLIYRTAPEFQEYELHQDIAPTTTERATQNRMEEQYDGDGVNDAPGAGDRLDLDIGLCVDSGNPGGDCGYFLEGWMGGKYVALDNNADELCELLVEFEDDDKKTLATGEEWDLGGGFALVANRIDLEGDKVWFLLKKDGKELDNEVTSTGESTARQDRVYTYTADIGNEEDIPVFSCYVDAVYRENDTNVVQVMYVFLIDDDVLEIETSDTYGAMDVKTASSTEVVLTNDETTIDLGTDTKEPIMGNMYFVTADDDCAIRFYPMVEYTEPGTYEVRGTIAELDGVTPTLGVDRVWDYSTFAGFWYDLDDNLEMESLTILATVPSGETNAGDDTLDFDNNDRTIDENTLIYRTALEFQEYELHQDIAPTTTERGTQNRMEELYDGDGVNDAPGAGDRLDLDIGLCVESDNPGGDCGYFIEAWIAEEYVAIDANADKLCKLLVEFEGDDFSS
uniref:Major S-layer protein n=1 Tax=Candidatus Methanogaster sp. ANME-2c ERB4 TaxID=2759911 RepID=A0A7G9YGT7_9EURY|nr:major S-layer protein [Methanosarcinales archaeon ANME-2c ERB4]QNO47221.1 major S-layer protein [Methanosarcinales archaeon ANME-2c ERB4]QNO47317.1 major S-layer protein [Methanosarcinales archaeon ANME-2c ERB4]